MGQVFKFAGFITPIGHARVQVFSFGPDLHLPTQILGESGQWVNRRGAEKKVSFGGVLERFTGHGINLGQARREGRPQFGEVEHGED